MLALIVAVGVGTYFLVARQPGADGPGRPATPSPSPLPQRPEPNELTVPEGRTIFAITNKSNRVMEWEILQGVMVVEEAKNIAPGFTQKLTARLEPGDYEIACGLLTNPRGKLKVTALANAPKEVKPSLTQLIGPLAEYKAHVTLEVDDLVDATKAFTDAIKAGDLAKARELYAPTRHPMSASSRWPSCFPTPTSRSMRAPIREAEADPAFTGFTVSNTACSSRAAPRGSPSSPTNCRPMSPSQNRLRPVIPPSKMVVALPCSSRKLLPQDLR